MFGGAMVAGGASPRAGGRAGGGPSGTTTAVVMVASAKVRFCRLSHGTAAAAKAMKTATITVHLLTSDSIGSALAPLWPVSHEEGCRHFTTRPPVMRSI